ncbi:MAG: hypothetical protein NUW37_18220 [Planctomycetes bacterium]|nr:hypothetical protein [Planctomycetota bacterium]
MDEKEREEIWKIVRENAEGFRELRERFKETAERFKETDEKFKETDEKFKETDERFKETDRQFKETDRQFKETDRRIAELNRKMAFLTDSWGEFVEDLVAPAVRSFYESRDVEVEGFMLRQKSRINGSHMEVDVICYGKTSDDSYVVAVCSVKNHMRPENVNRLIEDVEKFFRFFPQYQNCRLNAIAAGVRFDEDAVIFAQRQGIYTVVPSGNAVEFVVPEWFSPRVWTYAGK